MCRSKNKTHVFYTKHLYRTYNFTSKRCHQIVVHHKEICDVRWKRWDSVSFEIIEIIFKFAKKYPISSNNGNYCFKITDSGSVSLNNEMKIIKEKIDDYITEYERFFNRKFPTLQYYNIVEFSV